MTSIDTGNVFGMEQAVIACPYPFYDSLRDAPPRFEPAIGAWVVSRYADIREVQKRPDVFGNRYPTGPKFAAMMREAMGEVLADDTVSPDALMAAEKGRWEVLFTADPPLHDRQRTLVNRAFTPRQVGAAEAQVTEICERLIDGFIDDGHVELVGQFGWPLPLEVIATRLGAPVEDMPKFRRWSIDLAAGVGNHTHTRGAIVAMLESTGEYYRYFLERFAEAKASPRDDLLSTIATATLPDGDHLTDDEMLGMLSQILVAGHETTTNLVCMSMLRLTKEPEFADRLRNHPALVPAFVEEMLRLESPSQGMFRLVKSDTEVGGVPIAKGEHLFLVYASANRDPETFACPNDVDLGRGPVPPHMAFGHGIHYCLGAPLARQEARVALNALLARMADVRVADGAVITYNDSYMLRGLRALPLTFTRHSSVPAG